MLKQSSFNNVRRRRTSATARLIAQSRKESSQSEQETFESTDRSRKQKDVKEKVVACVAIGIVVSMIGTNCERAIAGGLNKKGNTDAYAEMMRELQANNGTNSATMSAESLFKEGGGACGAGYEMKVVLVTGAQCVCVEPELCNREGEMTAEERSYGKKPKTTEDVEKVDKDMMSNDGGIQFTFNNK